MSTMNYKGFVAKIEYDAEINRLCGTVINSAPHTFYGESVAELEREMAYTIEEYLKICAEKNQTPRKTYSGKLHVRIDPTLHTQAAVEAAKAGKSLNAWVADAITRAVGGE